jgi:hypothetical protein
MAGAPRQPRLTQNRGRRTSSGPRGTIPRRCRRPERSAARSAVGTRSIRAGRLCARSASRACTTISAVARSDHRPSTNRVGPTLDTSTPPSTRQSARRCRDLSLPSARAGRRTCLRLVLQEHGGGVPRVPRAACRGVPARPRRHAAHSFRAPSAVDHDCPAPDDRRHPGLASQRRGERCTRPANAPATQGEAAV